MKNAFRSLFLLMAFMGGQTAQSFDLDKLNRELGEVEQGAIVELSNKGLSTLSRLVYDKKLKHMGTQKLEDINFNVPLITRIKISSITVLPTVSGVLAEPTPAGIHIKANVDNIKVSIGEVRLQNYFIPFLATTCKNIELDFGNHNDLQFKADLNMSLDHGDIMLQARKVQIDLEKDQYETKGPEECRGAFSLKNYLAKYVFKAVIKNARNIIKKKAKEKVEKGVPQLASKINQLFAQGIPFNVPSLIFTPNVDLNLSLKPYELSKSYDNLRFVTGIRVENRSVNKAFSEINYAKAVDEVSYLGTLGLNPDVINMTTRELFKNGSLELELTPGLHEIFASLLRVEELEYFWPDLAEVRSDSEIMKAFVKIDLPPKIDVSFEESSFHVSAPRISLRFQLKQGDQWINYFHLYIKAGMNIKPTLDNNILILGLFDPYVEVDGEWAEGYHPNNPVFEKQNAQDLLDQLMQFLVSSKNPVVFDLPALKTGGSMITLDHLRLEEQFVKLDIYESH